MKNKLQIFVFLTLMMLIPFSKAYSQLKIDAGRTGAEISDSVVKAGNGAADTANAAVEAKKGLTFLDKVKLFYERQKARAELIQKAADTGKKAYTSAENVADEGKSYYESEKAAIESQINDVSSNNSAKTALQVAEINKQMRARKDVLSQENNEKAKAAQENYDKLKFMVETATDDATRQSIQEMMTTTIREKEDYEARQKEIEQEGDYLLNDSEYRALQEQKKLLESELMAQDIEGLKSLANQFSKKFSKKDKAQTQRAYLEVIDQNFLKEDENVNQETTDRIMKYRRQVLLKDINNAFYTGAQKMIDSPQRLEQIEKLSSNVLNVDLAASSASLLIEMRIEELKYLFDYVEVLLADMRLKTARNMLNQDYKLQNYTKNPAAMNLDNYIFTEKDIKTDEGQKSFLDNVKPR